MQAQSKPEPKFSVGQVVVLSSSRKQPVFRICSAEWHDGEWFYGWNSKNAAAEHMLRKLNRDEVG